MKNYIVFYTYDTHGLETMQPVFDLVSSHPDYEATLLLADNTGQFGAWQDCHVKQETRQGLQGKSFQLGGIFVDKKPVVVLGFRSWWNPDRVVCNHARQLGIPTVMINHGAMFIHNKAQTYKADMGGSLVNCIWGKHDLDMWRMWNKRNEFVITGNPLHDQLVNYKPEPIDVPDDFALLLTPRGQRKYLNPSAKALNEIIPVVAKCHPIDDQKQYYKDRYQTFTEPNTLFPLLFKAKYIITNVTSALIPALFWQKPIFIHSFATKGYDFNAFENKYKHVFNFKRTVEWSDALLNNPIVPNKEHYSLFGHMPDGNNSNRIFEVIKYYAR